MSFLNFLGRRKTGLVDFSLVDFWRHQFFQSKVGKSKNVVISERAYLIIETIQYTIVGVSVFWRSFILQWNVGHICRRWLFW